MHEDLGVAGMKTTCGTRILVAKTCNGCGQLRMAKHFSTITQKGRKYRNSQCHFCNNKVGHAQTRAIQNQTLSAAERHRQPWTEGDLNRLAQMVSEGLTTAAMAVILKRSVYSVNTMRNKLRRGIV